MGRFQLESIYLIFHRRPSYYIILAGTTVENKGKLLLYILRKIKSVAYSSQGSNSGQLDFWNWLSSRIMSTFLNRSATSQSSS